MARSQQSFAKRQKELSRKKRREDKAQRKKERAASGGSSNLNDMMAYVDEFGRLTSTPPEKRALPPQTAGEKRSEGTTDPAAEKDGAKEEQQDR